MNIINIFQVIVLVVILFFFNIIGNKKHIDGLVLSKDYTTDLRGIAILLVIVHHVGCRLGDNIFTPLGGIGVALFLIISGYGLNESFKKNGNEKFWQKKIVRVLIPCWIIEIISALINISSFEIKTFIKHILCLDINWFIRYLFYCYFVFWISSFSKYRIYVLILFSLLSLFLPEIEAEQSFSFILGVFISEFKKKIFINRKLLFFVGYLGLGVSLSFLIIKQTDIIRQYSGTIIFNFVQLLIKCPAALFILLFYEKINIRTNKFITFSGLCSYELYLTHCKLLPLVEFKCLGVISFYFLSFLSAFILYKIDNYKKI